jgi:hypothetical protein
MDNRYNNGDETIPWRPLGDRVARGREARTHKTDHRRTEFCPFRAPFHDCAQGAQRCPRLFSNSLDERPIALNEGLEGRTIGTLTDPVPIVSRHQEYAVQSPSSASTGTRYARLGHTFNCLASGAASMRWNAQISQTGSSTCTVVALLPLWLVTRSRCPGRREAMGAIGWGTVSLNHTQNLNAWTWKAHASLFCDASKARLDRRRSTVVAQNLEIVIIGIQAPLVWPVGSLELRRNINGD